MVTTELFENDNGVSRLISIRLWSADTIVFDERVCGFVLRIILNSRFAMLIALNNNSKRGFNGFVGLKNFSNGI